MATGTPRKLPNGNLLVPVRLEGPGGTLGDAVAEIGPDHPEFEGWVEWMKQRDRVLDGSRKPGRSPRNPR